MKSKFKIGDMIYITNNPDRGFAAVAPCVGIITKINNYDCIFYIASLDCHDLWLPVEDLKAPTELLKALS